MATRYGGYCYEDNLEEMTIDKLQALKEVCDHIIKEKHREEIRGELARINLLAHSYGFDIVLEDCDGFPNFLNELTLNIRDHK